MTLTLPKSPSVASFMPIDFLLRLINRLNEKFRLNLFYSISSHTHSLYPFFNFALKRNNSLFQRKELFPLWQETFSPKRETFSPRSETSTSRSETFSPRSETSTSRSRTSTPFIFSLFSGGKCSPNLFCPGFT